MANSKKNQAESKESETSWGGVANWYDDLLESGEGTYQSDLILPNVLRLLEIKSGQSVLDLACGQGFFSREFFKVGAAVSGSDISPNLIALAQKNSPKNIEYFVAPADKLVFAKSESKDAVVCILAIQNIENAPAVLSEAFRVLKKGGKFLMVMNHPTFRIAKRSSWGFDEKLKIQYRRLDEYISESKTEIAMHPGSDPASATVSFHHPLQYYFKALYKAGFLVSRLEEWNSGKTSQPGPRAGAENKARSEFPLFLTLEARKPLR
ncbi:MAG: methyltransferase domain-containing protein [Patescibacteria group bacterium]